MEGTRSSQVGGGDGRREPGSEQRPEPGPGLEGAGQRVGIASGTRTGTVTFLFTDIEGSTTLLQQFGDDAYRGVLADHDLILRSAIAAEDGEVFGTAGDAVFGVFRSASAGIRAAAAAQRALARHPWPEDVSVRVRMAVHTGEAIRTEDGDYTGLDLHRVARILSAGWGGQVLVSRTTADLVTNEPATDLVDLGEHRLKDLTEREHLFQLCAPGLEREFPSLRSLDAMPNNLPTQLTSFIGREQELATAARLLDDTRLLTLTGPGGTGKTRLSLRLAFEVADRFSDGAFFVDLSSIFEPDLVASEILTAFGLPESGARPATERLLSHLGERHILLVLDNFEQVLDAAGVVSELLTGAPELRIVVTSRAPLRVYGEQEFPVPPLRTPDPGALPPLEELAQAEAVALFIERASAVRPGFRLDASNAVGVATIARKLDGLPLAIELAAARTKLLTPAAIAERLSESLKLLAGGSRDLPGRQQTLRGAIQWSWDLLDDAERCLLARLAVFLGGASFEAVEGVCGYDYDGDLFDGLAALVDHSLVRQREIRGEPRFDLLETIREFGLEKLTERGEGPTMRGRHLAHFLDLAERAEPHLTGSDQTEWLDRLEHENDNLRAALVWAIDQGDGAAAQRMLKALWRFWQIRGQLDEGLRRSEEVLGLPEHDADPRLLAGAYEAAGGITYWMGDHDRTLELYERSLELYREVGDDGCVANALYNLAFPYLFRGANDGDLRSASSLMEEAVEMYEQLGDRLGAARAQWAMGDANYFLARRDETHFAIARTSFTDSLAVFEELDQPFDAGWAERMLGMLEMTAGDLEVARGWLRAALQRFRQVRDVSAFVMLLDDFRVLAQHEGDEERAVVLFGAVERLRRESGTGLQDVNRLYDDRADPGEGMDPDRYAELLARGEALSEDQAIALALET